MFGNSKPIASLSSGLLARKGQARPAMRPQGFVGMNSPLEDLGWNDMGAVAPIAAEVPPPAEAPVPPVLRQREKLTTELTPMAPAPVEAPSVDVAPVAAPVIADTPVAEAAPVSPGTLARIGREAAAKKGKAAFTLRLDAERHLRLRLASAVRNQSAQRLVTDALDQYLASVPDIDALARQLDDGHRG